VTTTIDTDTDIDVGEFIEADYEEGFVYLEKLSEIVL